MIKNIILTGFMGSGKSTVGRLLAERLSWSFVDLDAEIVAQAGMSVSDIFAKLGEPHFRQIERQILQRVLLEECQVVATGGGVVLQEDNRRLLRQRGLVINFTASVESILQRVATDHSRPLLSTDRSPERIKQMIAEREPCYAECDLRIATDGREVGDIVEEILRESRQRGIV
ncbi:MAG TPA: shikimate kinase [Geobacterales bacterium]|nr:shikimate kinase [Geobacterales bacterium]